MENKLLYVILILLSVYCIYLNLSSNAKQEQDLYSEVLKESIEIEDRNRGKDFPNANVFDSENRVRLLYDVFSSSSAKYYMVIVTSISSCSTCREQLLDMWNELIKKDKTIPVFLIISEDEKVSKKGRWNIKANITGLELEIPFFIDQDASLLKELGISVYQTPLSMILSQDKKIIAVNKASQIAEERSVYFRDFFLSLNSF